MQSERRKATVFVALVFLCGALAGAVGTNLWVWAQSSVRAAWADSPSAIRLRSVEWFTEELNLSPEQASQLKLILDETRNTFRTKEEEIDAIRQHARERINQILNDQQRVKYLEIRAERDRKRGRKRN
ncbi:MAG: hypothetical protein HY648_04420 [Acidobacteria bacterium]|nr:hypothetical protein [Acidobacteriota bacterium]